MKKILAVFVLIIIVIFVPMTLAQENFRSNENPALERDEVINTNYFSAGDKVVLSGTVNGDAYLAGGNIIVDGVVNGDLLAAGGNINIVGNVAKDIRVAGGNITISGNVAGNITTVGGNIRVDKGAVVSGSMVAAGGNIEVFGPIEQGLTLGAGNVTLGSSVGSGILASVGQLSLVSGADVKGDVTYFSTEDLTVSQGATVSGTISKRFPPVEEPVVKPDLAGVFLGWALYSFLTSLFLGVIFLIFAPNFMQRSTEMMREKPWVSLGLGFLTLIVTPFLILVLFITVVGMPFAVLLLVAYFFLLFFAKVFTAIFLGGWILQKLGSKQNIYFSLTAGLIVLYLLGLVPIIGGVIGFVSMLFGLGAYVYYKRVSYLDIRSKKLI